MKRYTEILLTILLSGVLHAQSLQPDTFDWTGSAGWIRTNSSAFADINNIYMVGVPYVASNTLYTSTGATQNLTSAGVEFRVGDLYSNLVFYATVVDATNGICVCTFTIPTVTPTLASVFQTAVQCTVTSGTMRVTYKGQKYLYVVNPLH